MFSFHKPRVYRSTEGCCICRAKSSSSRFTDSRKYEGDSMKCFALKNPRHGEICNACVLLVKRYKRLPVGSNRHWGHVVDARAGPGTKSLTKYKKGKEPIDNASSNSSASVSAKCSKSTHSGTSSSIQEKFSKIFKKKRNTSVGNGNNKWSYPPTSATLWDTQLLSNSPGSQESDELDDKKIIISTINGVKGTAVKYQTNTRSKTNNSLKTASLVESLGEKHITVTKVLGSKRRKCFLPKKDRCAIDTVQFFDDNEWRKRKTCCGIIHESLSVPDLYIIQTEEYIPCPLHCKKIKAQVKVDPVEARLEVQKSNIIVSAPAVVKLTPFISTTLANVANNTPVSVISTNTTTALKKHHLFFKRQSECFPHADLNINNTNGSTINNRTNNTPIININSNINIIKLEQTLDKNIINHIPLAKPTITKSSVHLDTNPNSIIPVPISVSSMSVPSPVTVQSLSVNMNNTCGSSYMPVSVNSGGIVTPYIPKHSSAKITTISTRNPNPTVILGTKTTIEHINKPLNNIIPKIKSEVTKISSTNKHSSDKSNSSMTRLKSIDLPDMKHIIKTVSKSASTIGMSASGNSTSVQVGKLPVNSHHIQPIGNILSIPSSNFLPTSNSSISPPPSSAPKFNDNSSDSGFDENIQDRKSASPLQEETERKIMTRGGVQTLFLASGVQIQGQTQNAHLVGSEVGARILQNRKQAASASIALQQKNAVTRINTSSTIVGNPNHALKIAQISVNGSAAHPTKMRAIYNKNTIQHENGVTTIVPASSLAATSQTAAMNAIAPSTVTITPAPVVNSYGKKLPNGVGIHMSNNNNNNNISGGAAVSVAGVGVGSSIGVMVNANNQNNVNNIILSGGAMHLNAINSNSNNNNNTNSNSNSTHLIPSLNQKIILVNARKYNNNGIGLGITTPIGGHTAIQTIPSLPSQVSTTPNSRTQSMCKN